MVGVYRWLAKRQLCLIVKVESYDLGVNSYIIKPVDFQQFNEAARTLGMYWLLINQPPGP